MISLLDIENVAVAKQVLEVQLAAYRVEAQLIRFEGIPPLRDSVADLQMCGESFLGYYVGETLAGALSYERDQETLRICRLMVHPRFFRKGIAKALLNYLFEHLTHFADGVQVLRVSTGTQNVPAKNLYMKNGFREVEERELPDGVQLSYFERGIS